MRKDFPRGSEWRKWDLHIHTPDSALNNQFTSWDSYLAKLEEDHGIAVIGATDYASISGYKRLRKEQNENGRIQNIFCIIPNIEFRVTPHTHTNKGVNLHIIINPDDPEHIDRIDEALNRLTFGSRGQQYSCNEQGLIRLGKAVGDFDSDEKAFREGANQFKPGIDTIRTWYEKESWLKRNSFIAVANSNKDGASGYNQDGGLRAVRLEFYDISRAMEALNNR